MFGENHFLIMYLLVVIPSENKDDIADRLVFVANLPLNINHGPSYSNGEWRQT